MFQLPRGPQKQEGAEIVLSSSWLLVLNWGIQIPDSRYKLKSFIENVPLYSQKNWIY